MLKNDAESTPRQYRRSRKAADNNVKERLSKTNEDPIPSIGPQAQRRQHILGIQKNIILGSEKKIVSQLSEADFQSPNGNTTRYTG